MNHSINIIGHGYVGGAMSYVCDKNNINYNVCDTKYTIENKENSNKFNNVKDLYDNSSRGKFFRRKLRENF